MLNFYRRAIALRKELSCVRDGDYREYGKCSSKLYTYSREDEKQKILVICSFSEKSVNWKAPGGIDISTAELLLCNYKEIDAGEMKPYEARVYR